MNYPEFFDSIETIKMHDELSEFLGATESGILEFFYIDLVKTAGHSCGVVAGAYLSALKGLKTLYRDELPERGKIKVELKKAATEDNAGVTGFVISNITGATTDYGFAGLPNGKFNRRELLFYNAPIESDIRLTRLDTGKQVEINYHPEKAVNSKKILMSALGPNAADEDKKTFPERFQNMVKTIFEKADIVIEVKAI